MSSEIAQPRFLYRDRRSCIGGSDRTIMGRGGADPPLERKAPGPRFSGYGRRLHPSASYRSAMFGAL